MKRRIRFLTDGGNAQENRALELAELFQSAGWGASIAAPDTRPLVERPRVDVLWVLDPAQARQIGDGRFGLMVWERQRGPMPAAAEAGALILNYCADAELCRDGLVRRERDCYTELDRTVKRELCEEVAEALGIVTK